MKPSNTLRCDSKSAFIINEQYHATPHHIEKPETGPGAPGKTQHALKTMLQIWILKELMK
jgi:hypothetical protein